MPVTYSVQIIAVDRDQWNADLRTALQSEISSLGLHQAVTLQVSDKPPTDDPAVAAFLGSSAAASHPGALEAVTAAFNAGRIVLPAVADLREYRQNVPPLLWPVNGFGWTDPAAPSRFARVILEELGVEDRKRRVFISHKRDDGLVAAERLADYISHYGFDPFIDRFDIAVGADVQASIADALEDYAFLLLLETPLAHTSDWVYDEVDYALAHYMGIHILTWPGDPLPMPGSDRLLRQRLLPEDIQIVKGYEVLTDEALDRTVAELEAAHATALVRRRRYLVRSVEEAAKAKGLRSTTLPGWRLLVESDDRRELVGVCPRLPDVEQLWAVDVARANHPQPIDSGLLVHAARILPAGRRALLTWAAGDRPLAMTPENSIGLWW